MPKTPQQVADRWAQRLGQAGQAITQGVQGVTENPAAKAAAASDRYAQGVARAVATGKYQRGLQRVSLEDWRRAMIEKGVPRVATGATAGKPKMAEFMAEWLPYMEEGKRKLDSMPRGDIEQNIARMVAQVQHASNFRRRG